MPLAPSMTALAQKATLWKLVESVSSQFPAKRLALSRRKLTPLRLADFVCA
jgi:hypothetical protein